MTEDGDIRYSWKDWSWDEWTESVKQMPPELREHMRNVIDQCTAPPLVLLTAEQIDAVNNPQIIQRVKGARYILELETNGLPMSLGELERARAELAAWWEGTLPFVVLAYPLRVQVIILPEVPE